MTDSPKAKRIRKKVAEVIVEVTEEVHPTHAQHEEAVGRTDIADLAADLAHDHAGEREQDASDRAVERESDRNDVSVLSDAVKELRASVRDLHDLILDSLIKSELASVKADAAPSRLRVNALVALSVLFAAVLAGAGIYSVHQVNQEVHQNKQSQYRNCLTRNENVVADRLYLARLNVAIDRADAKGSILAHELRGLLARPGPAPRTVDCATIR